MEGTTRKGAWGRWGLGENNIPAAMGPCIDGTNGPRQASSLAVGKQSIAAATGARRGFGPCTHALLSSGAPGMQIRVQGSTQHRPNAPVAGSCTRGVRCRVCVR